MLINGDSASLPFRDNQFHCVVTSPPYWGLRKYSGQQRRIWGGNPECEHEWGEILPEAHKSGLHIGGNLGADKEKGGRSHKSGTGSGRFEAKRNPDGIIYLSDYVCVFAIVNHAYGVGFGFFHDIFPLKKSRGWGTIGNYQPLVKS